MIDNEALGTIKGGEGNYEATLERYIEHGQDKVWAMLTEPERMIDWLAPGDIESQTRIVIERLSRVLGDGGATLNDIVKLNVFLVGDDSNIAEAFHRVTQVWSEVAPNVKPAITPVRVYELAHPDALIQMDCIAIN